MPRPRLCRRIRFRPNIHYFKPQGIPLSELQVAEISLEEIEALRLKNIEGLDQIECAQKMKTSQSTFQRILSSANRKVSDALINGKAIKIISPNQPTLPQRRHHRGLGPRNQNQLNSFPIKKI